MSSTTTNDKTLEISGENDFTGTNDNVTRHTRTQNHKNNTGDCILYEEQYMPSFLMLFCFIFIFMIIFSPKMLLIVVPLMAVFWKYHVRVISTTFLSDNGTKKLNYKNNNNNIINDIDDDDGNDNDIALSFGYSSFLTSKTIHQSDIVSIKVFDDGIKPMLQWGGWGIRVRYSEGSWQRGYIPKTGSGVQVTTTNKTVYVFNCENPEEVVNLLSSF